MRHADRVCGFLFALCNTILVSNNLSRVAYQAAFSPNPDYLSHLAAQLQPTFETHQSEQDSIITRYNFDQQTIKALGSLDDRRSVRGDVQSLITEHLRLIKAKTLEWCEASHSNNLSRRPKWGILPWVSFILEPQRSHSEDDMLILTFRLGGSNRRSRNVG